MASIDPDRISELTARLEQKLSDRTPRSLELYERAKLVMPGGVPSSFQDQPPHPIYVTGGTGSKIFDVDGNEYIDYHNGFGVMVVGHAHPHQLRSGDRQGPVAGFRPAPGRSGDGPVRQRVGDFPEGDDADDHAGVFAAFLLAFALSFDDFIISNFNSGQTVSFPLYIFGAAQRGIPPQVNVLGTLIFLVTVTIMLVNVGMQRRRTPGQPRREPAKPEPNLELPLSEKSDR